GRAAASAGAGGMTWQASSLAVLALVLAGGFAWYERRRPPAEVVALVATHDTEFAATFADRVVLLGQAVVIADASPAEVLGGGWHFSTDVARITDGAALTPEQGAGLLRDRLEEALA
ncbi:MAG TPA: hypothetical protein VFQ12_10020, partial [Thermoleophilaceae bacterium]|nr:hypothetical protein [Thermoleophilaceae bacterium]